MSLDGIAFVTLGVVGWVSSGYTFWALAHLLREKRDRNKKR